MKTVAELLQGLAAIAWPIITVALLLLFRSSIDAVVQSAKTANSQSKSAATS